MESENKPLELNQLPIYQFKDQIIDMIKNNPVNLTQQIFIINSN